jgi:hypothetical protein
LAVYHVRVFPDGEVAVIGRHRPLGVGVGRDGIAGERMMVEERFPVSAGHRERPITDAPQKLKIRPYGPLGRAGGQLDARNGESANPTRPDKLVQRCSVHARELPTALKVRRASLLPALLNGGPIRSTPPYWSH